LGTLRFAQPTITAAAYESEIIFEIGWLTVPVSCTRGGQVDMKGYPGRRMT